MAIIRDGGPAYPSLVETSEWNENAATYIRQRVPVGGMSLRDYFAAQTLNAFLAHGAVARIVAEKQCGIEDAWHELACGCYRMADAMLNARESQA